MVYKWCVVPQCTNTSIKTPEKLFVNVPRNAGMRRKWLQLAHRNPNDIVVNSNVFFCEDHFEMDKDIANYSQYKMGFSQRLLVADGTLPSKFNCQHEYRKRLCDASTYQDSYAKRNKNEFIQEYCKENQFTMVNVTSDEDDEDTDSDKEMDEELEPIDPLQTHHDKETTTEPTTTAEKSVQINLKVHYRSKAIQTENVISDVSISPYKVSSSSIHAPPCHLQASIDMITDLNSKLASLKQENSDNNVSFYVPPLLSKVSVTDTDGNVDIDKEQALQTTLKHIENKPLMYVGISKDSYFLVQLIHEHSNIEHEQILMCLKKIRLNTTFPELEDNFGLSLSCGRKLFFKNISSIASVLRPYIFYLDTYLDKKILPISFQHNHYNVSYIIDCLEIDIQPPKAFNKELTWSNYAKADTVKYLISFTTNGLINYISPGFGGSARVISILKNCNFIDELELGSCVLAIREFKLINKLLSAKGIKLLSPPRITSSLKSSKIQDIRLTETIASFRIHIEGVLRRLREFQMLSAFGTLLEYSDNTSNIMCVLNDVMVITCALVNIQDALIK